MHHVFRQIVVPASPSETWRALTDPARLTQWFATTDRLGPGQRTRFDFDDGDYFGGEVVDWQESAYLHLTWRFMDLGPRFQIRFYLSPLAEGSTEVTVHDHGSQSVEEVMSLRAGWEDFLTRLRQHLATGANVRYQWSESIGIGAILARDSPDGRWPAELDDRSFWEAAFPTAVVQTQREDDCLLLAFEEEGWRGTRTEARVETAAIVGGTYVGLVHAGWPLLPEGRQIPERRRYAGLWREALASLERRYAQGGRESEAA